MGSWKRLEREAAQALGGTRNTRGGDFGKSIADVEHELFSIETKYRAALPALLVQGMRQAESYAEDSAKIPVVIVKQRFQRGAYVTLKLKDFQSLFGRLAEQLTQTEEE